MSASSSSQPQSQPQQRSQSHARPHSQRNSQPHAYEFTKRKKWADILVANLPDTVYLLLDVFGNIQYTSPGVTDLLGWEAEELSQKNMIDLLNDEDKKRFGKRLRLSLTNQQDFSCYARLKRRTSVSASGSPENEQLQSTQPKELLFEIRGHTHSNTEDNANKSFYLMAKPYPCRNRAMLNTFFELKVENERLTDFLEQLQLHELPSSVPPLPSSATSVTISPSQYVHRSSYGTDNKSQIYNPGSTNTHEGKTMQGTTGLPRQITGGSSSSAGAREDEDEGGKKKKLKKHHASGDQHVCCTCGRTDSPEWRKGPRGPKTLCNACGLRWAKRSKKPEDANTNPAAGASGTLLSFPTDTSRGSSEQEKDGKEYAPNSGRGNGSSSNTGTGTSNHNSKRVPVVHAGLSVTPVPRNVPSHSMISRHTQTPSLPTTPSLPAPPATMQSLGSPRQYATHHVASSSGMPVSSAEPFPGTMDISMASGILAGAPSPMGMNPQSHHPQHAHIHGVQEVMQAMPVANEYSNVNVYSRYPTWNIGNAAVHGIGLSPESAQSGSSQHGQDPSNYHAHEQSHHQSRGYNVPFSSY